MDGAESSSESEMEVDDRSEEEMNQEVHFLFLSEPLKNWPNEDSFFGSSL